MGARYVPARGDVVWLQFDPQAGHEQAGRRPALVVSPATYNGRVGLMRYCPVTSHAKGYPFEVPLPPGRRASGVVLADQVKSLDWQARDARRLDTVPPGVIADVLQRLGLLLAPEAE